MWKKRPMSYTYFTQPFNITYGLNRVGDKDDPR